jgi:hydrogenase maturation factor
MSKSKQKGTLAETAVAEFLKHTFPAVERRTLSGANDKGDIAGVPGCVVEVKNQRTYKIHEWMRETEIERVNAGADLGVLVIKPNGVGVSRVKDWFAVISLETITRLIEELESAKRLQPPSHFRD